MRKKLTIVEDDDVIRENYQDILRDEGFDVESYANRPDALARFGTELPDLIILDISLGDDRDAGYKLCSEIRAISNFVPIIFLTSHDSEIDKISGMRLGADDYLTKDTSIDYLIVRIETLLRRVESLTQRQSGELDTLSGQLPEHVLKQGELTIDSDKCTAFWKDQRLDISLTQFWIVQELATKPGRVKTHSKLMSAANIVVEPNTVAAHVKTIRNKFRAIDPDFDRIKTEYGSGYRWIEGDI